MDLTVVDTLEPWMEWFESWTGQRPKNEDHAYDLVPEMTEIAERLYVQGGHNHLYMFNPMTFWKRSALYNDLEPILNSVEVLKELKDKGCHIVFVSKCVNSHADSKEKFLKRNFPFMDAFISTGAKEYIDYDVMIDDNIDFLQKGWNRNPESSHILFTQIRDDSKRAPGIDFNKAASWKEVGAKFGF